MLNLEEVTYAYPRSERAALQQVNLSIPSGQFCAVIGANGAGKSSLCYALTGFIPHFFKGNLTGTVSFEDRLTAETPLAELAGVVGLVFANPFNQITGARFTVREEIAYGLENMGVPREEMLVRVEAVMDLVGLSDLAERSPMALSGGQQQRLALASMIVMKPRLLVLDEPTSQLDPIGTHQMFDALRSLVNAGDTTIFLVSHKVEWVAAFAHRVLVMAEGRIVADGSPAEVLASPQLTEQGLRPTNYTAAARQAVAQELVDHQGSLPVTLAQATEFFT
jgi:energy-coupling factor transport system ATP-binding protein